VHGLEPFDDHFMVSHRPLLQLREPQLDPRELVGLCSEPGAGFGLPQTQNPAELFYGDVVVDQLADLGQRHTQVAQDQDAVQPEDLVRRVMPIAGQRIHVGRFEQTKLS